MINFLLISLVFPDEFSLDLFGLRLSAYRIMLLFGFFKAYATYNNLIKRHVCDYIILFISIWTVISLAVNHGAVIGIKSGGIIALETFSPYIMARVYVNNIRSLISLGKSYVFLVCLLPLFSIPENIYGVNYIKDLFIGGSIHPNEIRLGLHRAEGGFNHPILLGVFAAGCISLSIIIYKAFSFRTFIVVIASFSSLSSVAFIMVFIQLIIMHIPIFKIKKSIFIFLGCIYVFVDIILGKNILNFLLSHFTLNPQTAYFRKIIYEFAYNNVIDNPIFGLGFNDWVRPYWLPYSVDSFWMVEALKYGFPVLFSLIYISYIVLFKTYKYDGCIYSKGIVYTFTAIVFAGITVHFWGSVYVLFFFIVGCSFFNYGGRDENSVILKKK